MTTKIKVRGLFESGNAYFILARCKKAARKAGWTDPKFTVFANKAKSGDFDHLLQTVMEYFDEESVDEEDGV